MSFYFETLRQSDAWMDILVWFQLDVASFSKWDFFKTTVLVDCFSSIGILKLCSEYNKISKNYFT